MPPASTVGSVAFQPAQFTAGGRFELIHDSLGPSLGLHDHAYMIGPYVGSRQVPTTMRTVLPNRYKYYCPTHLVQHKRLLEHRAAFASDVFLVENDQPAGKPIVMPVY
jgi:hypothetical protein